MYSYGVASIDLNMTFYNNRRRENKNDIMKIEICEYLGDIM